MVATIKRTRKKADKYASLKKDLTKDQINAFDLAIAWATKIAKGKKVNNWFVICGYAGVGKSFLTQRLIPALKEILGQRVGACAPTHKAVAVLSDFCGDEVTSTGTIHHFLHLKPDEPDENGERHLVEVDSKHPHYRDYHFMIVDESSMIGEEIIGFIPRSVPTIFLGDIAQLPPVEDGDSISPLLQNPDILLTEVVRYKGAIADHVYNIRQNLEAKNPPKIKSEGNLLKYTDRTQWEEMAFKYFSKSLDPHDVKMLAWSNKEVENLNKKIRNRIYSHCSDRLYVEGEQIIAKEPITHWSPEINNVVVLLKTCEEATIQRAVPTQGYIGILSSGFEANYWELIIEKSDETLFSWLALDSTSIAEASSFLKLIKQEILNTEDFSERRKMWGQYYRFCDRFAIVPKGNSLIHRLQYSYALTVHQSQGSTFKKVFINGLNLFGCQETKMRNQLLYTGFTRAKDELHVLMKF